MVTKDKYFKNVLLGKNMLLFDGAMGSLLQTSGVLVPGQNPVFLNIDYPDVISNLHEKYVEAGAQVITSNTFRANRLMLKNLANVYDIFKAAYDCAQKANSIYIAANIGPIGEMLEPYGDIEHDEAYDIFAEQIDAINQLNYDFILIETMTDLNEALIAVRAAKSNSTLPIFATMSFESSGFTLFGANPRDAAIALVEAGAVCVGLNCSVGPNDAIPLIHAMRSAVDVPIICQPNAGLPHFCDGKTVYNTTPSKFCEEMKSVIESGATLIGSCCGTTPEFTKSLARIVK